MTNYSIWITIIVIVECFLKNSLLGIVKSLDKQKSALYLNMLIYLGLTIPLVYVFAFEVQKHGYFTDNLSSKNSRITNNRGVAIWIAFVIGSALQNIAYMIIIGSTDWNSVSKLSRRRFQEISVQYSDNFNLSRDSVLLHGDYDDESAYHSTDCLPYGEIIRGEIIQDRLNKSQVHTSDEDIIILER